MVFIGLLLIKLVISNKGDYYIMINIRKRIFETNSSSTHALCISKKDDYEFPNVLYFKLGNFGWNEEIIYGYNELASYLWTAICDLYGYNDYKYFEDYKNYLYEVLYEYGVECDFETPVYTEYGSLDNDVYVNHVGELDEILKTLKNSPKKLIRFLFAPDSFIITGNDNSDWYFDKMETLDFSNVDVIEKSN